MVRSLTLFAPIGLVCAQLSGIAYAQPAPSASAALPVPVCLTGKAGGGADEGKAFVIAVPSEQKRLFTDRKFAEAVCDQAALTAIEEAAKAPPEAKLSAVASHELFCGITAAHEPSINAAIWQRYSFTPDEGCSVLLLNTLPYK